MAILSITKIQNFEYFIHNIIDNDKKVITT